MLARGNQVLLFEIDTDETREKVLENLIKKLPSGKKFSLIIGGHGAMDYLAHSEEESGDSRYLLDPTDFSNARFINLLHKLNVERVIFEACSVGSGGAESPNLANLFAKHVQLDCQVFAPTRNVPPPKYIFNEDGSIDRPIYGSREDYTYPTKGKYVRNPFERFLRWVDRLFSNVKPRIDQLFDFDFNEITRPAYGV
jgi:hypothetical protein